MKTSLPGLIFKLLLVLLVSLIAAGSLVLAPILKNMAECFENGYKKSNQDFIAAQKEGWTNEKLCGKRREIINSIYLCFEQVEVKRNTPAIAFEVARLISPRSEQLENFKTAHNLACATHPSIPS